MTMNRFIINHVGYLPDSPKHLVYDGKAEEFMVYRFIDCRLEEVFTGKLTPFENDELDENKKTGDFSDLKEPGIYRIGTTEGKSRCFVISEKAYDTVARLLVNYFNWQRCGDPMGWNGVCHTDDRIILKNGEERSLVGGHHQSSDVRKWTFGTILGIMGLLKFALREKPEWDINVIESEIRHNLKYYLALVSDEGYLFDSSFTYEGDRGEYLNKGYGDYSKMWERRQYFDSPSPAVCQWQAIQLFAMCARYFERISPDSEMSAKCLDAAKKVYKYMKNTRQEPYQFPIYPPLGHVGMEYYYAGFYENSAMNYAGLALSAMELYVTEPCDEFRVDAHKALESLEKFQIKDGDGKGCFIESEGSKQLANNYFYFFGTGIPQAFVMAAELWLDDPSREMWLNAIENIAELNGDICKKNSYNRVPVIHYSKDYHVYRDAEFNKGNVFDKQFDAGKTDIDGEKIELMYGYEGYCYNLDIEAMGIFFKKAADLLGNPEYIKFAQSQLDWILGANRFDASNVVGVGYNVPHRGIYGEFFPPVPQIPGGVYIGYTDECFNEEKSGMRNEYDSPMVGWLMYLISVITE